MLKFLKKLFTRKEPKRSSSGSSGGGPYRTPGKVVEIPKRVSDKWLAVCHQDLDDGNRVEYILGVVEGSEEEAMDKAKTMMMNYMFKTAFHDAGLRAVLGGYGLLPMTDEEFEEAKRRSRKQ